MISDMIFSIGCIDITADRGSFWIRDVTSMCEVGEVAGNQLPCGGHKAKITLYHIHLMNEVVAAKSQIKSLFTVPI